jgi:hypothetical protein
MIVRGESTSIVEEDISGALQSSEEGTMAMSTSGQDNQQMSQLHNIIAKKMWRDYIGRQTYNQARLIIFSREPVILQLSFQTNKSVCLFFILHQIQCLLYVCFLPF